MAEAVLAAGLFWLGFHLGWRARPWATGEGARHG